MNNIELSNASYKKWREVRHKHANSSNFNLDARTKNLIDVKNIVDDVGISFWLTNGTILAAYRDHDWIKWDDDVDLDTYEEDLRPNYDILKQKFMKAGFIVRGTKVKYECKMSLFRDKEKTALRGLYLDPNYKGNKYRLRKKYKYPKKFYETHGTIEFKGNIFRAPSPIEEFLIYAYGKGWKTPLKSDNEKVYSTKDIRR